MNLNATLPNLGRVSLTLHESLGTGGSVPVLDEFAVPIDRFDYAIWSGRSDEGDEVSVGFLERNGAWGILGATVRLTAHPNTLWMRTPEDHAFSAHTASPGEPAFENDLLGGPAASADSNAAFPADLTPTTQAIAAPSYPIGSGTTEARTADLVAFAASGVTPFDALFFGAFGAADFNTAMDNSASPSWPISDVSVRLVGIGTVAVAQTADISSDSTTLTGLVDGIRASLGADLAVGIYPNRWSSNGTNSNGACGGWNYGTTVGLITVPSNPACSQLAKYALAHELGHAYRLAHEDQPIDSSANGINYWYQIGYRNGTLLTLMAAGDGGRSLQVANPAVNFLLPDGQSTTVPSGVPASPTNGTVERNNARWLNEHAADVANRATFVQSAPETPGRYQRLATPTRLLDTRASVAIGGCSTPMSPATPPDFSEARRVGLLAVGIPTAANAVMLNITTVNSTGSGWIGVNSSTTWPPVVSSVANFKAGTAKATGVIVTPGELGILWVRVGGASTDVIIDVMGYFAPNTALSGLSMTAPTRICETRALGADPSDSCANGLIGPTNSTILVSTPCPAGSTAAAINLTSVNATASGYLSVAASGIPSGASALNFSTTTGTIANFQIVPLDARRRFVVASPVAQTDLVADQLGCFGTGGKAYVGMSTPTRLRDTRPSINIGGASHWMISGETELITAQGTTTVAFVNVTITDADATANALAWPAYGTQPTTSTVNYSDVNPVRNNFALVDTGSNNTFRVTRSNQLGGNYLIVDQLGGFV